MKTQLTFYINGNAVKPINFSDGEVARMPSRAEHVRLNGDRYVVRDVLTEFQLGNGWTQIIDIELERV